MLSNEQPFQLRNKLKYGGDGVQTMTLTGALTLTRRYEDHLNIDPGGASRDITASADVEVGGYSFSIYNAADAAENLVFKNSGGSTIVTIPMGGCAKVVYDGANAAWKKVIDVGTNSAASILSTSNTWTGNNAYGIDGTGVDVTLYGDTVGKYITWDFSADVLRAEDSTPIGWGSGAGTTPDIAVSWDGTRLNVTQLTTNSEIRWGVDGAGIDQRWYGDTAGVSCLWDQSRDTMVLNDNAHLGFGSGAGAAADIEVYWDGTDLLVAQLTANSAVKWGVDGAGLDQVWYGDTASAFAMWDQSADTMVFSGAARIQSAVVKSNGATAITTTRAVTRADSGAIFTVDQGSAYTITVAQPTHANERYIFQCVGPAANDVSIVATGCTFEGTITIDGATIPATGSTLKFASGAAVLGDNIELIATSTTKFFVRAIGSGAGGITIS